MKLLKDNRDSLRGGARPPRPDDTNDDDNDDDEDKEFVSPLLEEINNKKYTNYEDDDDDDDDDDDKEFVSPLLEEINNKKYSNYHDKVFDVLNEFKNHMENKMSDLDKMVKGKEDEWKTKLNKLNNDTKKIGNYI